MSRTCFNANSFNKKNANGLFFLPFTYEIIDVAGHTSKDDCVPTSGEKRQQQKEKAKNISMKPRVFIVKRKEKEEICEILKENSVQVLLRFF